MPGPETPRPLPVGRPTTIRADPHAPAREGAAGWANWLASWLAPIYAEQEVGPVDILAALPPLKALKAFATMEKVTDKALDLSHAARMERAAAQGYGPAMYHETESANVPGLFAEGFDLNRVGARAQDEVMPNGVFLKPTEKAINVAREPLQLPVRHRAGALKEFQTRDDLERFLLRDEEYAKLHTSLKANEFRYKQEFDAVDKVAWRSDRPAALRARARLDEILDQWKASNSEIAARARERATHLLRETGAEGIHVAHDPGSFGRTVDTTVVFDPSHVRYPDAAFDPSQMSSKDLLASLAALGVIPLSQLGRRQPQEPSNAR